MKANVHVLLLLQLQILACCYSNKVEAFDANTDRQALLTFKSLVSDPQQALSRWNLSSSPCSWFGVTCTRKKTRVRSLRLPGLKLSGVIPPLLSSLTSLEELELSSNFFHGYLPPQLGYLPTLKLLDVFANNITGPIPPTLGNLSSLRVLDLSRNKFSSKIPDELGSLRNLQTLQLSDNQFTGEVPSSIFNISSLVYLSLRQNYLVGELPANMGFSLPSLQEIYLGSNRLEGPIPISLSNASTIQFLDLSANGFRGSIPLFGNLNNLFLLNLGQNILTSTTDLNLQVFQSLTNCTQLKYLLLNSNQLAGELPSSVANLSTLLEHLCIDDNHFTGTFPQGIEKFQNLISIAIQKNLFTGDIPSSVGMLKKLQKMSVDQNNFSGSIPDVFSNLTVLYRLTMGYNQFYGRIPVSIRDCKQLNLLDLASNKLNGSVPKEIFGLPSLNFLYLAQNNLQGFLPIEVGSSKQLAVMDVSANQLSGSIPAEIKGCNSLHYLSMANNKITGSIPEDLGQLVALESLDLSSNNLSGPIPAELGSSGVLRKLNLSYNYLEGPVPSKGVFMNLTSSSLQGNSKLCSTDKVVAGRLGVPNCITNKKSNGHLLLKIIASVAGFAVLISATVCIIWTLASRKEKNGRRRNFSSFSLKGSPPKISYSEISRATNNFSNENLVGKGGFGSVYKGVFYAGDGVCTNLAIKVLDLQCSKAFKTFNAECEAMKNIRHRNLVKVFTSCSSIDHKGDEFKALVLEFMSNGNLDKWLYPEDADSGSSLTMIQRLNIIIDIAAAMDYLHHDCDPPLVHCDLKPANVLLDDDMTAHIGDFGLARFLLQNPPQSESSTIGVKGSIGYIAPEYGLGYKVSTSGDVYSFGILLLEILMAKKPTDEMFEEGLNLNKYAAVVDDHQISEIADPRLFRESDFPEHGTSTCNSSEGASSSSSSSNWKDRNEKCVAAAMRIGLSCVAQSSKARLTMREALIRLREIKKSQMGG